MGFLRKILNNIKKFFTKTSVKIALGVILMTLSLLSLLNIFFVKESKDSFVEVVENSISITPTTFQEYEYDRFTGALRSSGELNLLQFNIDGTQRSKPLQNEFVEDFQQSVLKVTAIGVLASFAIGFVTSQIFTRPLLQLRNGMKKLRKNDYKLKLENTGTLEFDEVIDEFNNLTAELQRVENLRKDLISDTSHELKTPLASLQGQLEGLKDGVLDLTDQRLDDLIGQVQRLNELVESLQEFSRLRNKNRKLNLQNINLNGLIKELVEPYEAQLEINGIKVNVAIPSDMKIVADRYMFERVISNLLLNALYYSKANNIFIVGTENEKSLIFKDDGVGINNEHLPYIFERFYRVEKSRHRSTGGLGLGLSIVKEIVEAHGWKIICESQPGEGTQFTVSF